MGFLLPRPDIRRDSSVAGRPRLYQWRSGRLRIPSIRNLSGADGIRTHDPHVANVMLSQLSYCPIATQLLYYQIVLK